MFGASASFWQVVEVKRHSPLAKSATENEMKCYAGICVWGQAEDDFKD
jgi:hypothetical protein